MIINKGSSLLVMRFKGYKDHSFIQEHSALISSSGGVWMFKLGRPVSNASLKKTVGTNNVLILRSPKTEGGQLYICTCSEVYNGKPKAFFNFPSYYQEMMNDYYWLPTEGTWFYLTSIKHLSPDYYSSLKLINNGKPLMQALDETRTVCLYVQNDSDIIV